MEPMWTYEDAHNVITALQEETREFLYHVVLGGGVLNNGESYKDLDLVFLPLIHEGRPDAAGMFERLQEYFGEGEAISKGEYPEESAEGVDPYAYRWKFLFDNRRIDAFIL